MVAVIKDMNKDLSSVVMSMAEAFLATGEKNSEVKESCSSWFETLKSDNQEAKTVSTTRRRYLGGL